MAFRLGFGRSRDSGRLDCAGTKITFGWTKRQTGDEIVLEGKLDTKTEVKWIFSDITEKSFSWRAIESTDGFVSENKVQEMVCLRTK